MVAALGLHLLQWLMAFLVLDRFFQWLPMEPKGLKERLAQYRLRFQQIALLCSLLVGLAQLSLSGTWGLGLALVGWLPWWLLWRFGWRKQLTHLYVDDGGQDLIPQEEPDHERVGP